jgi:predicted GNAT family N-acyltransferase
MQVHVVKVNWDSHQNVLSEIRNQVFVVEQKVDPSEEYDVEDALADHFVALNEAGQALGCARLVASGQIGRMAVYEQYRGSGLGADLLQVAVEEAKAQGMQRVFLHAQAYAEEFYRKGGFVVCGAPFSEVGIPHLPMEMMLPVKFVAPQLDVQAIVRPVVVESPLEPTDPKQFTGPAQAEEALSELLNVAARQLFILSPYLDHEIFDCDGIVEALSRFARLNARCQIRIVIMNSKLIVHRGHRLLELARRLDDKIKVRVLDEPVTDSTSTFVCADAQGYWLLPVHDQYDGVLDLSNPVITNRLQETFTSAWEKSKVDQELRLLRL